MNIDKKDIFLEYYKSNHYSLQDAIELSGNQLSDFRLWMQEDEFSQKFNALRFEISTRLQNDSQFRAIQIYAEIIERGYYEEKIIDRKVATDKNGKVKISKTIKTVRKNLTKTDLIHIESFEKSLINLTNCGLIDKGTASRMMLICQKATKDIQDCFGGSTNDVLSEKVAINLVRRAVLGDDVDSAIH